MSLSDNGIEGHERLTRRVWYGGRKGRRARLRLHALGTVVYRWDGSIVATALQRVRCAEAKTYDSALAVVPEEWNMTKEEIKLALEACDRVVRAVYTGKPERASTSASFWPLGPSPRDALAHCAWMIQEALAFDNADKAMRWLCFVQGVLWMTGSAAIDELRDMNRGGT